MSDYRTFVVPYDFSVHARAALFAATDLAKRLSADLHLIHVVHTPSYAYGYAPTGGAAVPPPIVMGTHGRTGLAHVFLGSVAERTLRSAPCAVLTIQSPEEDEVG